MLDSAINAQSLLFALFSTSGLIVDQAYEDEIEIVDHNVIDNVISKERRRMRVLSRQIYDCSADLYVVFGLNSSETLKELLLELNRDGPEYKALFYQVADSGTFASISIIGVVESSWSLAHIANSFLVIHVNADGHDIEVCILPPTQANTTNCTGQSTRDIVARQSADVVTHFSHSTSMPVPMAASSASSNGASTSIIVRAVHSPIFPTHIPVSIPNVQWLTPRPVPVPASGGFTLPPYVDGCEKDLGFANQMSDHEGGLRDDIHDGYRNCPVAWTWRGRSPSLQYTPASVSLPPPESVPSAAEAARVHEHPLATCAWVGLMHHQARAPVADVARKFPQTLTSVGICGLWVLQPNLRVPCASSDAGSDDDVDCAPFSLGNVRSLSPHVPLLWEAGPCSSSNMAGAKDMAPAPQPLDAVQSPSVAPPTNVAPASHPPAHTPPLPSVSPTHASSSRTPPSVSPPAATLPAPASDTGAATTPRTATTIVRTAISPPWVNTNTSAAHNSPSSLASTALSRATHPSADTPPSRPERLSRQQRRGVTEEDLVISEVLRAVQTGAQLPHLPRPPRREPLRPASPQLPGSPPAPSKRKASRSPIRTNSPPACASTTPDERAPAAPLVPPASDLPKSPVSASMAPLASTQAAHPAPSSSSPPSPPPPAQRSRLASTDPSHPRSERLDATASSTTLSGVGEDERNGSGTVRPVISSAGLAARLVRETVDVARLPVAGQLVRTLKSDARGEVRRRQAAPSVPAHVARVLEEPMTPLQCRECGTALDAKDSAALKAHWTREHNYFVCGEREYAEGYTLEDTGGDGKQVAVLRFTLCQSKYRNASDASTHRSEHKFVFQCSLCEGSFTTEKSLKTHLQKHCAMLKGVACPTCRAFTGHSAAQLRSHLLSAHSLSAATAQEQLLRLLGRTDASTTTHLRTSGAVASPANDARRRSREQQVQRGTYDNDDEDSNVQTGWPWLHKNQMNG